MSSWTRQWRGKEAWEHWVNGSVRASSGWENTSISLRKKAQGDQLLRPEKSWPTMCMGWPVPATGMGLQPQGLLCQQLGRLKSRGQLLGRLSVWAQLLEHTYVYLYIPTSGTPSCPDTQKNRRKPLLLSMCGCSQSLSVICVDSHAYTYICSEYVCLVCMCTCRERIFNPITG